MQNQTTGTGAKNSPHPSGEIVPQSFGQPASSQEARLNRVRDYQESSLAKENPLEANLGSINSGLMRVALWLDDTIEQALESGPRNVDQLRDVFPAIDTYLRVTRQVDRFAQIELRAVEARQPKTAIELPSRPVVETNDTPALEDVNQSEDSEV